MNRDIAYETRQLDGRDFIINPTMEQWRHESDGYLFGSWFERIFSVGCANIKRGWTFLDAGANFGAYAFICSPRTQAPIFCFEPSPMNYPLLQMNIASLSNVNGFKCALGNTHETMQITYDSASPGASYLTKEETSPDFQYFDVDVRRLNDFDEIPSIDMAKIDVEGWGFEVLQGGMNKLFNAHIIMIEFHDIFAHTYNQTQEHKILDILKHYGFSHHPIYAYLALHTGLYQRYMGAIFYRDKSLFDELFADGLNSEWYKEHSRAIRIPKEGTTF